MRSELRIPPEIGRPWQKQPSPYWLRRMLRVDMRTYAVSPHQCWEGNSPELWVRVVEGLPPEAMKFFSQWCAGYPTHELSPPMG